MAPNLHNTLIEEAQFKTGYVSGPLSTPAATLWENAWAAVSRRERRRSYASRRTRWTGFAPLARPRVLLAHVRAAGRGLAGAVRDRARLRGAGDRVRPRQLPVSAGAVLEPAALEPAATSRDAFSGSLPGGEYWPSIRNTLVYVAVSLGLCFAIGYPVAYYVARHAKRTKTLLIVLLVIPFWVSYLLRMLAWIGLLSPGRLGQPDPQATSGSATRPTG